MYGALLMPILDAGEPVRQDSEELWRQDQKNYRGTVVLLLFLPVIIFPFFTGRTELVIGVSLSMVMAILAIIQCWNLSKRVWFWVIILLIQALHASLAFFAHWPIVTMTRLTLLPIGVAYYLLILGVVRLFDKFIFKSRGSSRNDPAAESNGSAEL
jgi:hypothetical protein